VISFVCPFCAKPFNVQDQLGGQHMNCPQCGGTVTVPLVGPHFGPAPTEAGDESAVESANRKSWWALITGAASLLCNCLTALPATILAIMVLSKSSPDPGALKPAKIRALLGLAMGLLFCVLHCVGFVVYANKEKAKKDAEIAQADAAYSAKRWSEAKALYEKHRGDANHDIKAKCEARLGRIAYAEGNKSLAEESFQKSIQAKSEYAFECEDPEVMKLWRKTRNRVKREKGELTFEIETKGPRKGDLTASSWRLEGKKLTFSVNFKSDPKKLRVSLVLYGEDDERLKEFYWEEDRDRRSKYLTPDYTGDWDEVRKVVLFVEAR